jgi:vacuolar-type H+-ATPase subunit D/Vma8
MKAKYQKYYDALKGANLSGGVSKISSAVNSAKTGLSSMQSSLSSSSWTELGAMTVNNVTIPSLIQDLDLLNTNVTGALTQVVSLCTELVSQLTELEALEKKLESLGDKWTYTEGGSKTQSEVNSHNNQITQTEEQITAKEATIDGTIASINGVSLATVSSTTTSAGTNSTGTDLTATPADTTTTEETTTTTSDGKVYSDGKKKYSIPSDPTVAAKKAQFLGDCDDPNNYTTYTGNNLYGRHNVLTLFDNTTGEIIQDHGSITLKPGETRIITVKLPSDTGEITKITRTTADGNGAYRSGKIVTARSDIDPDPNKIEYVRLVEGAYHEPSDMSLLKNNSYDWIITAKSEGTVSASQTCLWTSTMTGNRNLKAMINLKVNVVSDGSDDDEKKKKN